MSDATNAERQRRHRRHRAGDHSLCHPGRCPDAPMVGVTAAVTQYEPVERGPRGRRLWRDEGGDRLTGARRELLDEACRVADRLDRLNAILAGDPGEWMRFRVSEDGAVVTVTLDKALAEARQQALTLKQLLAELRMGASADKPATGGGILDQLAAKRAQRFANPAG